MKLISMRCPHCGAELSIDMERRQAFCQYCGNMLLLDDENTININKRIVDEARLKEAEIRLKELEYQHEREIRQETIRKEQKRSFWISVAVFVVVLLISVSVDRLRPFSLIVVITGCVLLSSRKTEEKNTSFGSQYLYSPKSRTAALLLCFFLGLMGVHRFYVGKVGTGILYFFTLGGFGIGWLIDMITIACGVFRDGQGNYVKDW